MATFNKKAVSLMASCFIMPLIMPLMMSLIKLQLQFVNDMSLVMITNVINVINNKIMTFELVISGILVRCGHFKDIDNIIKGII